MHMMLITGDHKLALGARLSGMAVRQVYQTHSAAWAQAMADQELGALYVSEEIAGALSAEIVAMHRTESLPLVLVLPKAEEE